jgi:putative transposase
MSHQKMPRWQRWAGFRFAVIGSLLASPPKGGELQKELQALAERTYQHPFDPDKRIRLGFSTIERWYYKAKDTADPLVALGRKTRVDAGRRWAVADGLFAALEAQYHAHPRWTVQLHYDNLAAFFEQRSQSDIMPSYKTVLRCMREKGWVRRQEPARPTEGQRRAAERLQRREVRSYEASHVHGLWHADFHQARVRLLDESGQWQRPVALAILDDHSRLCCHLQFYLAETAECLVHGLTQAIMKRGLPRVFMTDNGAAMLAEETRQGLARLSVDHKTTLPYSPYQNGKQEVFWAQLEGRLLELVREIQNLKLAFLNHAAQAWVEQDYHRNDHSEIRTTPLKRMLDDPSVGRPAPSGDTLKLAFTRQITRTPRRSDATVVVDGIRYELPARFAHLQSVTLRSPSWDKSQMTLVDPKTGGPLARLLPQDKAKNASGLRRASQPSSSLKPTGIQNDPMPALLRKWLADYAATGLPPAYLPKEEICYD